VQDERKAKRIEDYFAFPQPTITARRQCQCKAGEKPNFGVAKLEIKIKWCSKAK
jgi:hypothetical protein